MQQLTSIPNHTYIPFADKLWNSLPVSVFPTFYDLIVFKRLPRRRQDNREDEGDDGKEEQEKDIENDDEDTEEDYFIHTSKPSPRIRLR